MKTLRQQLATCAAVLTGLFAQAQPLHQPIPTYTNDGPYNRVGTASYIVPSPIGGFMEETLGGIGADGTTHYLAQNAFVNPSYGGVILEKKSAGNGGDLGLASINIGVQLGQAASTDRCRGLVLSPALNRVYLYGVTDGNAFILCYDMSTLALVPGFGTGGVAIIETGGEATGMVLTGTGNNFLVAINKGGTIILREYTSALATVMAGTVSATSLTYQSSWGSLKKAPNGHYFMAGSSTNASSVVTPMIWDCIQNTSLSTYTVSNSTNPASTALGTGNFVDYDFYVNPAPANPSTYLFDLVVVGNTPGWTGIYAKYVVSTTGGYYTPEASFKNQATLPGTAVPSNITATGGIKFTRCIMANNGYATVLGYFLSASYWDRAVVGYLTPNGGMYTTTYLAQLPTPTSARIHKAGAMIKDASGNVLVSGCTMGETYSIIKLSNTYDCRPAFNLKGTTTQICQGESASLTANISTPNCLMTWKTLSPTLSTVYSGMPISLLVTPNVTTIYECTVTNQTTGCTSVATITVQVLNDPSFSLSINTASSSYFTLSALANDQTASSSPGFGFAWFVEELDMSNNVLFTFSNPSCWWYPLSTPNVFSGIDCIANTYSGTSTIANCTVPPVGKFRYGHRYRITRGTWTTDCNWRQQSIVIQPNSPLSPPPGLALQSGESDAADFSFFALGGQVAPVLSLYPNPNNGSFTIESDGQLTGDCSVYDVTGKLVKHLPGTNGNRREIDLGMLRTGVYYLKVAVNGSLTTEKFIVD